MMILNYVIDHLIPKRIRLEASGLRRESQLARRPVPEAKSTRGVPAPEAFYTVPRARRLLMMTNAGPDLDLDPLIVFTKSRGAAVETLGCRSPSGPSILTCFLILSDLSTSLSSRLDDKVDGVGGGIRFRGQG
jgi:hypothetical protein